MANGWPRPLTTSSPVPYLLFVFLCQIIAVLWPSGYGVTFRLYPIRDGKPREFESRQCQLFLFISLVSCLPQPEHHTFQPHLKMCYRALLWLCNFLTLHHV